MEIIYHPSVHTFISKLDKPVRARVLKAIGRLSIYGKDLSMPDSKPIGSGLWELRIRGHPAIRILYGFYENRVFFLVAFKKQSNAIRSNDVLLAQERLRILYQR